MTEKTSEGSNSGRFWAWVPALLLGSMLLGLGSAAYIAIDDPHFALEPDYYDKAVHWDRGRAEARQSEELGLRLSLAPLNVNASGTIELRLSVADRGDGALSGAEVAIEAFPNAYASKIQQVSLREVAPGVYAGELSRAVSGLWELRVSVKHAGARYREALRREAHKAGAA